MGTNFYWKDLLTRDEDPDEDLDVHIGKRSAAGAYCWDCGTTLCLAGTNPVHFHRYEKGLVRWSEVCPSCGNPPDKGARIDQGAGAVELGFAKPQDQLKTGVRSCASFSWTLMKHRTRLETLLSEGNSEPCVVDEYGREYTAQEFLLEALAQVPRSLENQIPGPFS